MCAFHVVIHNVLKFGLKSFLIDNVKVNVILRHNLNSNVALDIVNISSDVNRIILHPRSLFFNGIILFFEKQDLTRDVANEGLSID